jgi:hypothetical protein
MDFNRLGIAFICDDVLKDTAGLVEEKMQEIIARHKVLGQEELDQFLSELGLESAMGVIINKEGI